MNYRLILLVITIFILSSCETSEDSFISFLEVNTSLPQASHEIASNGKSQPIIARINDQNRIFGVGSAKRFYTDDFFETVNYSRGFAFESIYEIDGNVIHRVTYDDDLYTFVIEESNNRGESFTNKIIIEDIYLPGEEYTYYPQTKDIGWLSFNIGNGFYLFKVEGSSIRYIETFAGTGLTSIWFDGQIGYIMSGANFSGDQKVVYVSIDFGETWGFNSTFELSRDVGNTPQFANRLLGHGAFMYTDSGTDDHMYISRDGGRSWQFYQKDGLRSFQFFDEMNGVAIKTTDYARNWEDEKVASRGVLYETSDGGKTWSAISNKEIYADRLFFLNKDVGLAMSYSVLQVTFNGGQDWQLLVYPLNEL